MAAFTPEVIRFGRRGVVLSRTIDELTPEELARATNLDFDGDGYATVRNGLIALATAGTSFHSVGRLNDPSGAAPTLVWGVDVSVYTGAAGALTVRQAGFSGNPLALVPYRPPNSGQTWMYIADSLKLRKVRPDGLILQVGLPKPSAPATALTTELTKAIDDFESGYSGHAGTGGAPTITNPAAQVSNGLNILTAPGAATQGYDNWASKAVGPIDLTTFGGGIDATDSEFIHLWLKTDNPSQIEEIRLYLVTSTFSTNAVPGTDATANVNAYMKAFRVSDLTAVIERTQSFVPGAISNELISEVMFGGTLPGVQSVELITGRGVWTEYGVIGQSLRKADFTPIGKPTWATVQGVQLYVKMKGSSIANVTVDNLYMRGGRGPDTAEPGAQKYDYRVTNYDPRTGAESNPSPEQAESLWLDSLRRAITIDPAAFGDAAIRQRVYRRGGSLNDDWYFVGTNGSDGAVLTDILSDEAITAAGTLAIDHDQPVTTLDANGAEVLASPVYALWGPAQDLLFACGDPYRAGHVYWCRQEEPDHWPAANAREVCSPSEELMNGCVWADQPYVWSRRRLYRLYVNLSGTGGVTPVPTGCEKGLAGRWAFCTSLYGMAFVSDDNLYLTTGGASAPIADDLQPLFAGETVNGYAPIDFTVPSALRLWTWQQDLWFTYRDQLGANQTWVYSFLQKAWRHYSFGNQIAFGFDDAAAGIGERLLLLGRSSGAAYRHDGHADGTASIVWSLRTGALTQGQPAVDKFYAGDVGIELETAGTLVTITPLLNADTTTLPSATAAAALRSAVAVDVFGATERRGRSISWQLSGATPAPLRLYWLRYTWAAEALPHRRWTSGAITHGLPALQIPVRGTITYRATTAVTMAVTAWQEDGSSATKTYTLASTGGVKRSVPILFEAQRGSLFTYTLTAGAPFYLYEDESVLLVSPLSPPYGTVRYVLGTDGIGSSGNPFLAAGRAGGA